MKSFVVCGTLLVIALSAYGIDIGDGRPGCKTEEEIKVQLYRNNWDPTAYWKCEIKDNPAAPVRCPDQQAFQDSLKKCVSWEEWQWEETRMPPSQP